MHAKVVVTDPQGCGVQTVLRPDRMGETLRFPIVYDTVCFACQHQTLLWHSVREGPGMKPASLSGQRLELGTFVCGGVKNTALKALRNIGTKEAPADLFRSYHSQGKAQAEERTKGAANPVPVGTCNHHQVGDHRLIRVPGCERGEDSPQAVSHQNDRLLRCFTDAVTQIADRHHAVVDARNFEIRRLNVIKSRFQFLPQGAPEETTDTVTVDQYQRTCMLHSQNLPTCFQSVNRTIKPLTHQVRKVSLKGSVAIRNNQRSVGMTESGMGFLEELYHGAYREDLLLSPGAPVDQPKVDDFVTRYLEIVKRYNPLELEKDTRIPDSLMKELKDLGIFGLTIPRKYGGLGFTTSEYLMVVEAMAKSDMALVLIPLAHLSIGLKGIVLFADEDQKTKYLTPAASGEMVFAYALTEPKTGSDAQHIETRADLAEDGTHYVLNGSKTYITNGNYAGGMTVFAQLDPDNRPGFMGAFIVETAWEGVEIGKDMPKMGLKVSSTTPIRFKNVKVPRENLIGEPGDGFKIAMNILNYGRLGLGAASAGLMKQSVEDMEKRATSRTQFGVPIRQFELIQEKIVRARAHAFASTNVTLLTARMLENDPLMNVAIESSHTKRYGTDECWNTLYDALQTAGGAGFIQTMPYEKRMRDFRVTTIFEGTSEIHAIYPPLTIFRRVGKELKGKGGVARLKAVYRLSRPMLQAGAAGTDTTLRRAMSAARESERLFRKLLRYGLVTYGKDIVHKEFFLRRMTRLSTSLFWLVSSVSVLRSQYGDRPISEEHRALMDYLIAEAKEVQTSEGVTAAGERERAHSSVIAATSAEGAAVGS